MLKATNCTKMQQRLDSMLSEKMNIEHAPGFLTEFLGFEMSWKADSNNKPYFDVNQKRYTGQLLTRFGYDNCHPVACPCDTHVNKTGYLLPNSQPPNECPKDRLQWYRAAIGGLMHLTIMTRPDIAYAVNAASQFMSIFVHRLLPR